MSCQIIGGGTAGLTIAERLSKQPGVSVAVVEGGSFYELNNGNLSQIPAYDTYYTLFPPSLAQPLIDWGFVTVPQPVRFKISSLRVVSRFHGLI